MTNKNEPSKNKNKKHLFCYKSGIKCLVKFGEAANWNWKKDNFKTNNRKSLVFGVFSRYFSLIWMTTVSTFSLNDILYVVSSVSPFSLHKRWSTVLSLAASFIYRNSTRDRSLARSFTWSGKGNVFFLLYSI